MLKEPLNFARHRGGKYVVSKDAQDYVRNLREDRGIESDSFYSESNIRYLEKLYEECKAGRRHFEEHELIEVDE